MSRIIIDITSETFDKGFLMNATGIINHESLGTLQFELNKEISKNFYLDLKINNVIINFFSNKFISFDYKNRKIFEWMFENMNRLYSEITIQKRLFHDNNRHN